MSLSTPLLILAGGRATRLKNLSQDCPKYLMPVDETRVFADVHLEWAKSQGFRHIILSIGYLGEMVRKHCQDGSRWGLHIDYLEDGPVLKGTGGAIRGALKFQFSELAITYGDTLLNVEAKKLLKLLEAPNSLGAMAIYKNEVPGHTCNIDLKPNGALIYDKMKPQAEWLYIDYGFMVLKRQLLESFPTQTPLDLAEPLSKASYAGQIQGLVVKDRFWEIGSPEALDEFRSRFGEN